MIYTQAAGPITCKSPAESQKEDKNECIPNMPRKALCNTYHVLLGMSGGVVTDNVIYKLYTPPRHYLICRNLLLLNPRNRTLLLKGIRLLLNPRNRTLLLKRIQLLLNPRNRTLLLKRI
jgi:hypothetical protein